MDPITQQVVLATAGAAGGGEGLYVDEVFSTFLYEGTSSAQTINNGINLGSIISSLSDHRSGIQATQSGVSYTDYDGGTSWQEVITDGILSGSNNNYLYSGSNALDIYVDLGSAATVTSYRIAPQGVTSSGAKYNTPSSLTFYGSNDGTSWTQLYTSSSLSFTAGAVTEFSFSNSTAYRYYRLASGTGTSISEWQLPRDSGTAGEGGLVWLKSRSSAWDHNLFDTERGAGKILKSSYTVAELTGGALTQFNSNGFSIDGSGSNYQDGNNNGDTYVSWSFRKAPGFFDVVTYTGTGSAQNISHSLGSVPGMIIVKKSSGTGPWNVYHRSLGANGVVYLNATFGNSVDNGVWNNTAPTSSVFTVGADVGVNANGSTYVAYIFAHDDQSFGTNSDEAIIKCGTYTGNGSSSGPVIDLGFEPQWLLIKRTSNTDSWLIWDTMRGMANGVQDPYLEPNTADAEDTFAGVDVLPTGFQLASSTGFQNSSGDTYIYMAIRRPHKPPEAGTEVFAAQACRSAADGTPSELTYTSNFPVDLMFNLGRAGNSLNMVAVDRLRGQAYLSTSQTAAENSSSPWRLDTNAGVYLNGNFGDTCDHGGLMFRRAPGFFDVVTYQGTGSARTVSHNLGVAPELMIVKRRSDTGHWYVYDANLGNTYVNLLSAYPASYTDSSVWNNTSPTSSVFTVGTTNGNSGADFVAYLFATLDGISKVGSYTGTGSNIDVNCGFTAGARFVLIKRTDSSGDWYFWDTARGIVSGNDPYLRFNSTAAEVTNTDYIDPLNAGFTVTSSAPAALNTSGGTYIFLAIA